MPSKPNWLVIRFQEFCRSTALHGWSYLVKKQWYSWDTVFWVLILAAVNAIGIIFIITNTNQYLSSTILTSIESTTTPLTEIYFPAVTLCNINQVEASMLVQMGVYGNLSLESAIYLEFVEGGAGDANHQKLLNSIDWLKKNDLKTGAKSFWYRASQPCEDFVLNLEFQSKVVYWHQFNSTLGPKTVPTDYGTCCSISTQISLDSRSPNLSVAEQVHGRINKGAYNGEANGLSILHESVLIQPGKQTHVVINPILYYTTDDAVKSLRTTDRQCYEDKEVNLTYFAWEWGYEYSMTNCLLNAAIDRILPQCNCTPTTLPSRVAGLPYCTGLGITCSQNISNNMGEEGVNYVVDGIRGRKLADKVPCFKRCSSQVNEVQLSSSIYPQTKTFIFRQSFCQVATKLMNRTCIGAKRKFLDLQHPNLCEMINDRSKFLKDCSTWPVDFFEASMASAVAAGKSGVNNYILAAEDQKFVDAIQRYASKNLARIKVMIRDPYVQKIRREQAMTLTGFFANTGGLLGLCLGFSAVSLAELLYHFLLKRY